MNIRPIEHYNAPAYPTMADAHADPELLSRVPGRWARSPGFTAMLSMLTSLAARVTLAGELPAGGEAKAAVSQAPAAPRRAADATHQVKKATSVVAPLLDDALKFDGRGSFGCMAINPPTFLSEDEAIELIRTELEAAGLTLKEDVDLKHVESPLTGTAAFAAPEEDEEEDEADTKAQKGIHSFGRRNTPRLAPQNFTFDLADTNRSVFIEYLSARDHQDWAGPSMSTVTSYDFPALAARVSASFQKVPSTNKRLVFGVFFDPLARAEIPRPDVSRLSRDQQNLARTEYSSALRRERAKLDDKAREKLREQVRNFVAFLNQEGVITKTK